VNPYGQNKPERKDAEDYIMARAWIFADSKWSREQRGL